MAETKGQLPRWRELPDLELYMDQVLSLTERWLGALPGTDDKGLTASMINNYVKLGLVPPPVKKRYGREQLATLVMVCLLKRVLPIPSIRTLLERALAEQALPDFYDLFCEGFEAAECAAAENAARHSESGQILGAALRAQAEQRMALRLLEAED